MPLQTLPNEHRISPLPVSLTSDLNKMQGINWHREGNKVSFHLQNLQSISENDKAWLCILFWAPFMKTDSAYRRMSAVMRNWDCFAKSRIMNVVTHEPCKILFQFPKLISSSFILLLLQDKNPGSNYLVNQQKIGQLEFNRRYSPPISEYNISWLLNLFKDNFTGFWWWLQYISWFDWCD